jgi:hypothetical protein
MRLRAMCGRHCERTHTHTTMKPFSPGTLQHHVSTHTGSGAERTTTLLVPSRSNITLRYDPASFDNDYTACSVTAHVKYCMYAGFQRKVVRIKTTRMNTNTTDVLMLPAHTIQRHNMISNSQTYSMCSIDC